MCFPTPILVVLFLKVEAPTLGAITPNNFVLPLGKTTLFAITRAKLFICAMKKVANIGRPALGLAEEREIILFSMVLVILFLNIKNATLKAN